MNRLTIGDIRERRGREPADVIMVDSENQTTMAPPSPMAVAGFRRDVSDDEVQSSGDRRNGCVSHHPMCFYIDYNNGGHHTRMEIGGVGCAAFFIALLRLLTFI